MLKLKAVCKSYIWGGDKLKKYYNQKSDDEKLAESWELSTHKDGICFIEEGGIIGESLNHYIEISGKGVLGTHVQGGSIPILIKLIDAKEDLSIQVHPDDDYAMEYEGDLGKTEMWYVVEAEEGAQLVYGFKEEISKDVFEKHISEGSLDKVLNYVDVKQGDVFFIEPGTLHAIGKGLVIAEVQQSSNVTYRVYDYGRIGTDGKTRALHIKQAVDVVKYMPQERRAIGKVFKQKDGYKETVLARCKYFITRLLEVETQVDLAIDETSFQSLIILEGEFVLTELEQKIVAKKGDSIFIPAHIGTCQIKGKGKLLLALV